MDIFTNEKCTKRTLILQGCVPVCVWMLCIRHCWNQVLFSSLNIKCFFSFWLYFPFIKDLYQFIIHDLTHKCWHLLYGSFFFFLEKLLLPIAALNKLNSMNISTHYGCSSLLHSAQVGSSVSNRFRSLYNPSETNPEGFFKLFLQQRFYCQTDT